jgi:hypothetical protein
MMTRASSAWFSLSPRDGRHHGLDAENVERPPQIGDARREAERGAPIVEASHHESALVHPLLDAAEGMLDGRATPVETLGPRLSVVVSICRLVVARRRPKAFENPSVTRISAASW